MLRAVAGGPEQLYAEEILRRFGLSSTAAVARAVSALEKRDILVKSGKKTAFDNPYFRIWVERELIPDTPRR